MAGYRYVCLTYNPAFLTSVGFTVAFPAHLSSRITHVLLYNVHTVQHVKRVYKALHALIACGLNEGFYHNVCTRKYWPRSTPALSELFPPSPEPANHRNRFLTLKHRYPLTVGLDGNYPGYWSVRQWCGGGSGGGGGESPCATREPLACYTNATWMNSALGWVVSIVIIIFYFWFIF